MELAIFFASSRATRFNVRQVYFLLSMFCTNVALSVIATVYSDITSLVNCRHETSNSLGNNETRFASIVWKVNAHGGRLQLPESISTFMLMGNAKIIDNHPASVLTVAAENALVRVAKVSSKHEARLSDRSLVYM